jgi:hypothetical protein
MLLPDADDEILLARCQRYRALPEQLQQLVRGYVQALQSGRKVTKTDWIKRSGLPDSTAYDLLRREATTIWPAITEAAQVYGEGGLLLGGLALCLAGQQLYEQLSAPNGSRRDTRTLTAVELSIMMHCAQGAGLLAMMGTTQTTRLHMRDDRGRKIDLSVSSTQAGAEDHLDALLTQERGRREAGGEGARGEAESLRGLLPAAAEPAETAVGEASSAGVEGGG